MVQVEDKSKALASESGAEQASVTAASEPMDTEVSAPVSEGEEKKEQSNESVKTTEANNNGNGPVPDGDGKMKENGEVDKVPDADVDMSAPELVNNEENKKEQDNAKKVDNKLSTPGGSSRKRKRKVKKVVKKAATPSAVAKTAAPEGAKMDVEAPAATSGGEANKEEDKKEVENASAKKGKKLRQRKKKKSLVPAKDTDKPETSTKEKDAGKKADSMGMIFMCSSKTKKDCYQYKVLGLPASKKEMVAKIYKGMRLFLFDIDLKLLYGIYKAAEPGGYNIEPKAFKSAFPSQVRFTVMEDCSPLPEEKFKEAIKENYYGKNKFDCQLKPEQVKSLCKLFRASAKTRDSKPAVTRAPKTESRPLADRSRERRQGQGRDRSRPVVRDRRPGGDRERRRGGDRERRPGGDRERRQGRDRERRPYERRAVLLPPRLPSPVPRTYAYERPIEMDYYRREPVLDYERREEMVYREPVLYRDPAPAPAHEMVYREPLYAPRAEPGLSYHEPMYTTRTAAAAAAPPVYHMPQLYRY